MRRGIIIDGESDLTFLCRLDRLHRDYIKKAKSRRSRCVRPKEREEQEAETFPRW
jgi:hypothetical protein